MSYSHSIGALDLRSLVQPLPTASTFSKEALYWAQIRTAMPRFASLAMGIASSNTRLSSTEKSRVQGEVRKLQNLVASVGAPSGAWSTAQLSLLRDAHARGGVPPSVLMSLINKSGVSTAISKAQEIRRAWTALVGLLGTRVTQTVTSIVSAPTGVQLRVPMPTTAPTPTPSPAPPSYVPSPTVDPLAAERAAAVAAAAGKTVGDLCALRTMIQGALAAVGGSTISVPSRGPMTADQLASLLNHPELVGMCSQDPSTPLSAHHDLAETYYALARVAEQLPMAASDASQVPAEWLEQHSENVLPDEGEGFPWKWVVLGGGLLVVGVGGYMLVRRK